MKRISLSKEEALARYKSRWWEGKSAIDIALTQLPIDQLILPTAIFADALWSAVGRILSPQEIAECREQLYAKLSGGR